MRAHRVSLLAVILAAACGRIGYAPLAPSGAAGAAGPGAGGIGPGAGSGGAGAGGAAGGARASGGTGAGGGVGGSGGGSGGTAGSIVGSAGAGGIGGSNGRDEGGGCSSATFNSHTYAFCAGPVVWSDAQNDCLAKGMRLARIDDASENGWIQATAFAGIASVSSVYWPWIGGTDLAVAMQWQWTDGAVFWIGPQNGSAQNGLYTNWVAGSPSGGPTAGHCAILQHAGFWTDFTCSNLQGYVCEQY